MINSYNSKIEPELESYPINTASLPATFAEPNDNAIKINPLMQEIIQESSLDIRSDFQSSFHYISNQLPREVRIPFQGTCMRVMRDGHSFTCGANKRIVICDKKETLKDYRINEKITAIDVCENDQFAFAAFEEKDIDGNGIGWAIKKLSLLTFEIAQVYMGHTGKITALAISPDETYVYSSSWDCTVRMSKNGKDSNGISEEIYEHDSKIKTLCISRDGLHLISAGDSREFKIYSIATKQVQFILYSSVSVITFAKFSPKKKYFAISHMDNNISIWSFETCEIIKVLKGHTGLIKSMKFTGNENVLVSGSSDRTVRVWSINRNHDEIVMEGHARAVRGITISLSEKHIYSLGKDYKILIWKFPSFDSSKLLVGHKETVFNLIHSSKRKKIYSNSEDMNIIAWDQESGAKLYEYPDGSSMYAMAISPDEDYLFSCTDDQRILIWDLEKNEKLKEITDIDGEVRAILCTPDNRFFITGDVGFRIIIWNMDDFSQYHTIRSHRAEVWALNLHENSTLYSGDDSGTVLCHDLKDSKILMEFTGNSTRVQTIVVTRNGEILLIGYRNGELIIWGIQNKHILRNVNYHNEILRSIYCTQDGKYFFAASEDQKMSIFDLKNFGRVATIKFKNKIKSMIFLTGENHIALALDKEIKIIKSPLKPGTIKVYGPDFGKHKFMRYIKEIMLNEKPAYNKEMDQWIIEPFHLNPLHFYAYFNLSSHLKKAIEYGDGFFPSSKNETPLSICLDKSYTECTNAIFTAMNKIAATNPYSFYYFEDSLITLNLKGFPGLEKFYQNILMKCKHHSLKKFCDKQSRLPSIIHSEYILPKSENFSKKIKFSSDQEGKDVMYLNSLVRLDLTTGSKESLAFLDSLGKCPNGNILKTPIIQFILNEKWRKLSWLIYFQASIYISYLVLLSIYTTLYEGDSYYVMIPFGMSCILTLYELYQINVGGIYYWQDFWNWVDLLRIILFVAYVSIISSGTDNYSHFLLGAIISLSWFRGTLYFNIFKPTRYLINLIFTVFYDMLPFFIILCFLTLAFAVTQYALIGGSDHEFFDWTTLAWRINIKDYSTDWYISLLMWASHWVFTVLNPIVMISLLISLMGDTFERVKENSEIADARELIDMLIEAETLLFWRKNRGKKKYLQVCTGNELEKAEDHVDKKLNALGKIILQIQKQLKDSFEARCDREGELLLLIQECRGSKKRGVKH
ncbi:unnamed protein product [Blepharisma stoltei]|uniref:Ion transport domain-containing protein n=1 Tax=Blepharisma stoltei TaxID=1481888 RepID=A0AAU9JUW7_9CILI|nr:unnamed protein product [Blepharisma stoltei]